MPHSSIPRLCAILCLSGIVSAQTPDYLPLQEGNQWVYQATPRGQPVVMEVLRSGVFDENTYYLTRNFLNADTWLRVRDDRTLVSYDPETKQESALVAFGAAEGSTYETFVDPCNSAARLVSRSARTRLPIGQFDNALDIDYPLGVCADAGIETEQYLPYVGLVRRTRQTIAGPVTYDLSYARIAGGLVVSAPEVTFSLTLDKAVYENGAAAMARLTLRVVQPSPLSLNFRSSQEFDLVVKNQAGDVVYRWSEGRSFLQALHTLTVGPGEKSFTVQLDLRDAQRAPLPKGVYTAEAWLTTEGPQLYRAQIPFEVSPAR